MASFTSSSSSSTSSSSSSFTISQPFIGAPLDFSPPVHSPQFENLLNLYIPKVASKQDKISDVTIDFYATATYEPSTGALFKRYDVALPSFQQSPTGSFSSSIFTPSPASSMTLADSGYGSLGRSPPARTSDARITKKLKKDTRKTAELRLPGFSIMTKDGVDVTTSAGRGTKTKEQREHAHLMRILKACDDCKRKKIRCKPAHRTSHTDMSRTSTSTSNTTASPRHAPTSAPSQPREIPRLAQNSTPPFVPSSTSAFDDFILFPEHDQSWDTTNISDLENQQLDLSDFNFDIGIPDFSYISPVCALQPYEFPNFQGHQDFYHDTPYSDLALPSGESDHGQWLSHSAGYFPSTEVDLSASGVRAREEPHARPRSSFRRDQSSIGLPFKLGDIMSGLQHHLPGPDCPRCALETAPPRPLSSHGPVLLEDSPSTNVVLQDADRHSQSWAVSRAATAQNHLPHPTLAQQSVLLHAQSRSRPVKSSSTMITAPSRSPYRLTLSGEDTLSSQREASGIESKSLWCNTLLQSERKAQPSTLAWAALTLVINMMMTFLLGPQFVTTNPKSEWKHRTSRRGGLRDDAILVHTDNIVRMVVILFISVTPPTSLGALLSILSGIRHGNRVPPCVDTLSVAMGHLLRSRRVAI